MSGLPVSKGCHLALDNSFFQRDLISRLIFQQLWLFSPKIEKGFTQLADYKNRSIRVIYLLKGAAPLQDASSHCALLAWGPGWGLGWGLGWGWRAGQAGGRARGGVKAHHFPSRRKRNTTVSKSMDSTCSESLPGTRVGGERWTRLQPAGPGVSPSRQIRPFQPLGDASLSRVGRPPAHASSRGQEGGPEGQGTPTSSPG